MARYKSFRNVQTVRATEKEEKCQTRERDVTVPELTEEDDDDSKCE